MGSSQLRARLGAVYAAWKAGAYPPRTVVSHLVLGAIFYGVIAPIGVVLRLCGHNPLARRFDPKLSSYWSPRPDPPRAETYFRQS